MKAEFNSAARTDLEVYVPSLPRSGRRSLRSPEEEEDAITRARVYIGRPILELRSLAPRQVGDHDFRR